MNKQEMFKKPIVVHLSKEQMPKTIAERDIILEWLQTNVEFKQLDEPSEARECECGYGKNLFQIRVYYHDKTNIHEEECFNPKFCAHCGGAKIKKSGE